MLVCWYVGMLVCMLVCMLVRMLVCMYVRMYVCMYVRTYVCMYVWVDGWMHACMTVCMYVCMYIWSRVPCSRERELGGPYHWRGGEARDPESGLIYIYIHVCVCRVLFGCFPEFTSKKQRF